MVAIGALESPYKIFHSLDCPLMKKIRPGNAIYFPDKFTARGCGYIQCIRCSHMPSIYKAEKEEVQKFCTANGLEYTLYDDSIMIENRTSAWRITTDEDCKTLILLHANTELYENLDKKNGHYVHHYHHQKYFGPNTILGMMKYIVDHDNWRGSMLDNVKNMPEKTKSDRKAKRKAEKQAKRQAITNVYNLIDKISQENKKR